MDTIDKHIQNKSILITGGGGYLGSRFLERILHPSSMYYIVDMSFNDLASRLAEENTNVKLINTDITHIYELERALTNVKPNFIFHFAAWLDRSRDFGLFDSLYKVNVQGTLNLLEIFQNVPYENFYFTSTSEVYGAQNPVPFHEEQIPLPLSPYSLTKLMAEEIIRTYSHMHQKPWVIARIFNFFGPDMPEHTFIPQLLSAWKSGETFLMTPGEQKRDYLFIGDLVQYLADLAVKPGFRNEIVNICSGSSVSMKTIAETVSSLSEGSLEISASKSYRPNELWDNTGSNDKLVSIAGRRNLVSFDSWIREYIRDFSGKREI